MANGMQWNAVSQAAKKGYSHLNVRNKEGVDELIQR